MAGAGAVADVAGTPKLNLGASAAGWTPNVNLLVVFDKLSSRLVSFFGTVESLGLLHAMQYTSSALLVT